LELQAVEGGLRLNWSTLVETDMYAWRVLRLGPEDSDYTRLPGGTIPAVGAGTAYSFTDEQALPGRSYSYVIEGVTLLGFSDRTHVIGTRVPDPD
jgi:hypothetical protein